MDFRYMQNGTSKQAAVKENVPWQLKAGKTMLKEVSKNRSMVHKSEAANTKKAEIHRPTDTSQLLALDFFT